MKEHFLNAEFDLSLRPRWHESDSVALTRQTAELSLNSLMAAEPGDSVLLPAQPPEDFLAYLDSKQLTVPGISIAPQIQSQARLAPFGWNARAIELNQRYQQPERHPDLGIVQRVNGRRFGHQLEQELFSRDHLLGAAHSITDLETILDRFPESDTELVLKSEHGNAGLGNRRLRFPQLNANDRRFVSSVLSQDDSVSIETWHDRDLDLCTTFNLTPEGDVRDLSVHEVVNTADGAFIGAIFDSEPPIASHWWDALDKAAHRVAERLLGEGYFGPVCLDSYLHSTGDGQRLRELVDLNARSHISAPAKRLCRIWGTGSVLLWRFLSVRKMNLPSVYAEFEAHLGDDAFVPDPPHGVLLTSPLRFSDSLPIKLGVCLVAPTRQEVVCMESRLRKRLER